MVALTEPKERLCAAPSQGVRVFRALGGGSVCGNACAVLDLCGEETVELQGEALDLAVRRRSNPHPRDMSSGYQSHRKDKVAYTSSRNEAPPEIGRP